MGFDITGIGSAFDFLSKTIDKIFPDKDAADQAKLKMIELQQTGEFKEIDAALAIARGQVDINIEDAKSGSNFSGGWRPFVGWVCAIGMLYVLILRPIILGVVRLKYPEFVLEEASTEVLFTMLSSMLGFGGYRTFERVKGFTK